MPKLTPIQDSFAAGEISPLLYGQVTIKGYQSGLAEMENMWPNPRGPAVSRRGTDFLFDSGYQYARLTPFQISHNTLYVAVIGSGETTIWGPYRGPVPNTVVVTTPWTADQVDDLHFIPHPGGKTVYIVHSEIAPHKMVYDDATGGITIVPVAFTNQPPEWNDTEGWPSTGTYHEGRLWLGGTDSYPQTFWASRSGLPEDFSISNPIQDDDALSFTMAKYGRIRWMYSVKNLLIGTENGEHIVTSQQGVITPSDISVSQQSAYGSSSHQPAQIGDQVFYISPDRLKIRAMQYEWSSDNWLSRDVTFLSEHISHPGMRHFAWLQNPNNILIVSKDDGTLGTLVYERSENVFGWSRYSTNGQVVSVCAGSYIGTDVAFMAVNRGGTLLIESLHDGEYIDSSVLAEDPVNGVTYIDGLNHLEGRIVQVTVGGDRANHPDRIVGAESAPGAGDGVPGRVYLDGNYNKAIAGLGFVARMKTLPFDKGAPGGSGSPWQKRWNKIYLNLLESSRPLINGSRPPVRDPATLMGTAQPDDTGPVLSISLGWDKLSQITIEQDLPRPLTVLSIHGELAQEVL